MSSSSTVPHTACGMHQEFSVIILLHAVSCWTERRSQNASYWVAFFWLISLKLLTFWQKTF